MKYLYIKIAVHVKYMADCEICGKKISKAFRAIIEGTEMNVCKECGNVFPEDLHHLIEKNVQIYCEKCGRPFSLEGVQFKEAKFEEKERVKVSREKYEEMVKGPGKFEGERPWVPYFWEAVLDGDDDSKLIDGYAVSFFIVMRGDKDTFAELKDVYAISVFEDEQGFVHGGTWSKYDYDNEMSR